MHGAGIRWDRPPTAEPGLADPATMNFEAVLAGLPDAVIAVDTELRVVFWNSAAEVLAERSARRAEGRLLKEVFPGDASIVRRLAETLASGESRSEAEALIERADRREVPVSLVTAALFGKDGNVGGAVAVLRDLSRIRQLEAEERARDKRIAIVRRYDPSLPPILGDEDRLVQVFHNLVRNAMDAMKPGGTLTLATKVSLNPLFGKMDLGGGGARTMVEAHVVDEGSGIPAAARAKIFDPFFTTKDHGLGLGLAICHHILEQHRGAIHVDSEEGRGTTVTCFLPIAR